MFERYLEDQKPNWKRRWLSIASIFLHGFVGAAVIAYTFFHVEEITPPAIALTFFNSAPPPPPPPPPPPGGSSAPQQPKVKKIEIKPDLSKLIQPTEIKPVEEKQQQNDTGEKGGEEGGEKGGVAGGEKGGEIGGEIGGKIGGVKGGTGTGPAGGGKNVAQFVLAASKIDAPNMPMPDWFYNEYRGRSARGTYKLCVGQEGRVVSMEVLSGLPGDMNTSLMDHVKSKWKFKPQPFVVCAQWIFDFQPK